MGTVGQEIVICLLSIVALLPTLDIWGIHGLLLALRLDSVLHAGEKCKVPTCEMREHIEPAMSSTLWGTGLEHGSP